MIGKTIYKYKIIKNIGDGNSGSVWLAEDLTINAEIALKILDSSDRSIVRQLDEARIGNKLNHPNLLKILYADIVDYEDASLTCIAQEYHPTGSVERLFNPGNFLDLPKVIQISIDILRGLEHLHSQGIYHNDIKPSNILIGSRGEGILADYGISGFAKSNGITIPKGAYKIHRAPETYKRNYIDIQTDIYQMGLTLFRMSNGIGDVQSDFYQYGEEKFEELKSLGKIPNINNYQNFVPQRIRRIINKAVNKEPSRRFSSALEMRREIEKCYYPGYWTIDCDGSFLGKGEKYHYRFETIPRAGLKFDFIGYKTRLSSGRETKIGDFKKKLLSEKEVGVLRKKFILWVIENAR